MAIEQDERALVGRGRAAADAVLAAEQGREGRRLSGRRPADLLDGAASVCRSRISGRSTLCVIGTSERPSTYGISLVAGDSFAAIARRSSSSTTAAVGAGAKDA